ncbi:siderophore ABC transporter substrate-binding protein [Bacillus sp. FJAT-47783]|uniref:siderophore ABC transporter substrate-binding protein n=1 Tax=Bacillus sp. FJAT-47783 TaxID=2922712 RepID=UPI001FAC2074|nr:siderophore ABC transporter substrate-binding protein [Bacillus sp. FJAT-47783]
MKKWSLFALVFTIIFVLAACGSKETANSNENKNAGSDKPQEESTEIKIKHELDDEEVVLEKTPEKVVVFDFGVLDTLDELGVKVDGVPQAVIPTYLERFAGSEYTNVGHLKEPDFEAIHELQPDVIFISARQSDMYEEFKKIAPTVYMGVDYENYMESFTHNMELLAQIFNKEEEMKKELDAINQFIDKLKEKTTNSDEKTLIVMGNEEKVSAFGPNSRFGIIHDVFGYKPTDEKIEKATHGQSISFEYILETNPDILFVIDRDAAFDEKASAKDAIENELVKKTNAFKNEKVFYLNGGPWYLSGGGLQSMKRMIEDVERGIE